MAESDAVGTGPAVPPRIKIRIESLSDLVFGLALSMGALILAGRLPQSSQELVSNVALFGFSFGIVVLTWVGYSRTMAVLPVETTFALVSNILLLFLVVLEPYLFYVVQSVSTVGGLLDSASTAYALDVGGMFFMQALLAYLVGAGTKGESLGRGRVHPVIIARFRWFARLDGVMGLIFLVSAFPFFWLDTPFGYLRFYMWSATFFVFLAAFPLRRRRIRMNREAT